MKITSLFALGALSLILVGCDNQSSNAPASSSPAPMTEPSADQLSADDTIIDYLHNASNSLDWWGTYQGVLPCADCAGIEYTLVLNDDQTYQLTQVYQGTDQTTPFVSQGKFHWQSNGNIITLEGETDEPNQYFVSENMLIKLDINGEKITGDLASLYQLEKLMP